MSDVQLVLVPGGGGSPWHWSRVVPVLQESGVRASVVDLPGPDPEADLQDYVDLVVAAVRAARESGPVVLAGLSFGGFSASAAALVEPVDELVLLNAMIPLPGESGSQWWGSTGQAEARRANEAAAGRDPGRPFDPDEVFLHDASPELVAESADLDRDENGPAFDSPWPGDAWPQVRTSVLVADDDRLFPPSMQARVARERLGVTEVTTVPGGHLNALTRPREVAAVLLDPLSRRPVVPGPRPRSRP